MLLYGPLVDQYNFEHSGKYDTGIGRWGVMVCYNSCYNNKMEYRTSYQQQQIYLVLR